MKKEYTAIIKQDGDWWIGWIEEIPGVNCQERSREELLESLQVTLKEALELNRQEALSAIGIGYVEEKIAILSNPSVIGLTPIISNYSRRKIVSEAPYEDVLGHCR